MPRTVYVNFEAGSDGGTCDPTTCPGLASGSGFFIADPHTGAMAATLNDAFANSGAGVLSGVVPAGVDGGAAAGYVGAFAKLQAGAGDTAQGVACQVRPTPVPTGFFEIAAMFTVAAADPDFPGVPFIELSDQAGATITKVAATFDTWYEIRLGRNGDWLLLDHAGDPLQSGNLGVTGNDDWDLLVNAGSTVTPARLVVDDYYWLPALPLVEPVTRLYPRDDGLGATSGPRLYPPSKANRLIGGLT